MNLRKLFIVAAIFIGLYLVLKTEKPKSLPTGNISQKEDLKSNSIDVAPEPIPGKPQVEIKTNKGSFIIELRPDLAPKTVANYLSIWSRGLCNKLTFHRVEDWVIQGCDPKGDGTGGASNLPTETSEASFTAGAVGVARKPYPKEFSNNSQFFIVKNDSPFLNQDYTYFGHVISGMNIINSTSAGDKIISSTILTK